MFHNALHQPPAQSLSAVGWIEKEVADPRNERAVRHYPDASNLLVPVKHAKTQRVGECVRDSLRRDALAPRRLERRHDEVEVEAVQISGDREVVSYPFHLFSQNVYFVCVFDFVKAQAMRLSWVEVEFLFETPTFPCVVYYAAERLAGLRGGFKEKAVGREVVIAVAGESMGTLRTVVGCVTRYTPYSWLL